MKYLPSQVLCTMKARPVFKLALKDSNVVYITYYKINFVEL